jgi:rRNA-processing protein FCF1
MSQLIKKNNKSTLKDRYSFATTEEMKAQLDKLKRQHHIDVNETFRQFAAKIIAEVEKQAS